jgi:hypothetical protein
MIDDIEKVISDKVQEEKEKAAKDKWNNIQTVDKKYKQKALEDFIINYSYSALVRDAKQELETFSGSTAAIDKSLDSLASAQDGKRFKNILESLNISSEDKEDIQKYAIAVYGNLKGKKQKNFFKEAQLGRLIDVDFENEVKSKI